MKTQQISKVVIVILLVILATYLAAQKSSKKVTTIPSAMVAQSEPETALSAAKRFQSGIKVTFVELGSVGCGPCDMMAPILDEIEKEYEGQVLVRFYDVNSMLGRPYAQKYRVQLIPTQVFLDKDGNEYFRHVGFFEKAEIVKVLQMQGVKQ